MQCGQSTSFAQVAVDKLFEQTMNRDIKTKCGIVRISLCPVAGQRWIVRARGRASIAGACKNLELAFPCALYGSQHMSVSKVR